MLIVPAFIFRCMEEIMILSGENLPLYLTDFVSCELFDTLEVKLYP